MNARRLLSGLALAVAVSAAPLLTATPASGAMPCEWGDTTVSPWNYPLDGVACVKLDTTNGIRLAGVTDLQPGWTYQVKSTGGTSSRDRVEIRFSNAKPGERVDFRYEPGKTRIG